MADLSAGSKSEEWCRQAMTALIEAQLMSEAIDRLAKQLIEESLGNDGPMLEAIRACSMRIERAVAAPLEFTLAAEVPSHG